MSAYKIRKKLQNPRNHDLEDEEPLKQTDIYEDYKLLNRLVVEQMVDMPFEELMAKLEANQTGQ